jgi:16S rRNA (guanine527-N7)-methyltransferase
MNTLLIKSGIQLDRQALERLWAYHNLLRTNNQDRDLTRITGFEPMVIKHYADCLWVSKLTELPSPIIDIGTGAGFPGIPLKIANPDVHFTLAEPRPRRVTFLKMVVEKLGLKGCEVFDHRVVSRSYQIPVKGVVTRALETLDKTFLRTSGCTQPGTKLIFMKGPNAEEEMRDVERRFGKYFRLIQDEKYKIPHTPHLRRLLVYEKTAEPFLVDVATEDNSESTEPDAEA